MIRLASLLRLDPEKEERRHCSLFFRKVSARLDGFSLIEVTLAIGVIAFALIVLFGLLPVGLSAVRDSKDETVSVNILSQAIADLRTSASGRESSPMFGIPFSPATVQSSEIYFDEFGNRSSNGEAAVYRLRWTARPGAAAQDFGAVSFRVEWPAQAQEATGSMETVFVFPPR